jgi:hypothetical protein
MTHEDRDELALSEHICTSYSVLVWIDMYTNNQI